MNALMHRLGLEFDLASPEDRHADRKRGIEAKILRKAGIIYAEFSKENPDIVIVEYDPFVTTPGDIYVNAKRMIGGIKRKVIL